MWSKLKPLCTLYDWADTIGIHPYLVAQITQPRETLSRSFGQCENPFYQYAHQGSDTLAREDVAKALIDAQELIAKLTDTMPAPYYCAEDVAYPRPANLALSQMWSGSSGRLKPIELTYGNVITMGQYEETVLSAGAAIVKSDPNADGFDTLATVTVAVPAGTVENEITVYFVAADRSGLARELCDIRPVSVSISGLVATITFPLILAVKIANFLKLAPDDLDATDASIYATTVDVYRRTVDIGASGTLIWETNIPCDDPPCEVSVTTACFHATNAKLGWVTPQPAEYDDATAEFARLCPGTPYAPDRVTAHYISGIPLVNGRLNPTWRIATAKLATALLPNKSLGCAIADLRLMYYRNLPTKDDGTLEVTQSMLDGASAVFGVAGRGAVEAYALLNNQNYKIGKAAYA